MKKVILIVLDSLGVGALPDAEDFGDSGADTFGHIVDALPDIHIPNLRKLGFCNIEGAARGRLKVPRPLGCYGRLKELSLGKDTITGHWEIAGIETKTPFKTYPGGFPKELIQIFQRAIGTETLGNYAASGTVIIEELGEEHEKTGKPIVYTSADSVFQIAANIEVIPLERLYWMCRIARELLVGEYACGRVIARPYEMVQGKRQRTADRKDYAVSPPEPTVLDRIEDEKKTVYGIGKISDIFNGRGITASVHTTSNQDGVDKTLEAMEKEFSGLIFTNLVEFDSQFGHRRDAVGYGRAIEAFDRRLPEIMGSTNEDDCLILCADHGNDPLHSGFDHTREYVPFVVYGKRLKNNVDLGTGETFGDIGATVADLLRIAKPKIGKSRFADITK